MLAATVQASREERERRQQERFRDRGGIFMKSEESVTKPLLDQLLARADKRAAKAALTPARVKGSPMPVPPNLSPSPTPAFAPPPKRVQKKPQNQLNDARFPENLFKKSSRQSPAEKLEVMREDPPTLTSPTKARSCIRAGVNSRAGPSSQMLDDQRHPSSPLPIPMAARVSRSKGITKTRPPLPEPESEVEDRHHDSASPAIVKVQPMKPRSIIRSARTGSSRRDRIKFTPDVFSLSVGGTKRRESLHSRPRADSKQYADEVEERIKAEEAALKGKGKATEKRKNGGNVKVEEVENVGLEDDEVLAPQVVDGGEGDHARGPVPRTKRPSSLSDSTIRNESAEAAAAHHSSKTAVSRVTTKKKKCAASNSAGSANSDSEDDVPIIQWARRPTKEVSDTKTSKHKPKASKKIIQMDAEKSEIPKTHGPPRNRRTVKSALEVEAVAEHEVPSPTKILKSRKRKTPEPEIDSEERETPVLRAKRSRVTKTNDPAEECRPSKPKSTPRARASKTTPSAKMKENSVSPRRRVVRAKAKAPKARPPLPIMSPIRGTGESHRDEFDFL